MNLDLCLISCLLLSFQTQSHISWWNTTPTSITTKLVPTENLSHWECPICWRHASTRSLRLEVLHVALLQMLLVTTHTRAHENTTRIQQQQQQVYHNHLFWTYPLWWVYICIRCQDSAVFTVRITHRDHDDSISSTSVLLSSQSNSCSDSYRSCLWYLSPYLLPARCFASFSFFLYVVLLRWSCLWTLLFTSTGLIEIEDIVFLWKIRGYQALALLVLTFFLTLILGVEYVRAFLCNTIYLHLYSSPFCTIILITIFFLVLFYTYIGYTHQFVHIGVVNYTPYITTAFVHPGPNSQAQQVHRYIWKLRCAPYPCMLNHLFSTKCASTTCIFLLQLTHFASKPTLYNSGHSDCSYRWDVVLC